jgi:glutathione synthase/RimK-type ligase-like ATP-grasp enzyme
MESNHSKPWQASLIRAQGFLAPDTLITNDPRAARRYWRRHGQIIYKAISSQRSVVSRVTQTHNERWGDLRNCPTQFQEWIPGVDVRVHVVGNDLFCSEISADADDYRYAPHGRRLHYFELPTECAERCRKLTRSLGLLVAGIDLRRTPAGEWYCFEVNPSPAFTFYQEGSRQPIAEAIARLLARAE